MKAHGYRIRTLRFLAHPWKFFLAAMLLSGAGYSPAAATPVVVSTDPPNGATGISVGLRWVSVTFSKPMASAINMATSNWGRATAYSWSSDGTTLTFSRENADSPLPANTTILFMLQPPGGSAMKDLEGNALIPYTFSFTTEELLEKVEANPGAGFFFPYYLFVPDRITSPPVLLVEPNNTGTSSDDQSVHDTSARSLIRGRSSFASDLGVPLLVPTFTRPRSNWQVYTHALDRDTLIANTPGLARIDLQLIAMIDDARAKLASRGIHVGPKVFLNGFSASGSFAHRFALLHPARVKAVCAGSPGGFPTLPVTHWEGEFLPYPVGIGDLDTLIGIPFDREAFRSVPAFIYIGDADDNDAVPFSDGFSDEERGLIYKFFGSPPERPFVRWPKAQAAYNSIEGASHFHVYHGVKHTISQDMWEDLKNFFDYYRTAPPASPPPLLVNPHRFKLYFPHVACHGPAGWDTQIGITNNHEGMSISGAFQVYTASGEIAGPPVPITLPPMGRVQFSPCWDFGNLEDVAYAVFSSYSGFVSGYTRFFQPGNSVALHAVSGNRKGVFAKFLNELTGLAFVNVESEPATVRLTALDDAGNVVASAVLRVEPGAKVVDMAEALFGTDLSRAGFIRYASDKTIVGFQVDASPCRQMLDGLPGISHYME
jgi:pimeloyl-ACP methyl ester carboxylesterase